jgi:hypothetical protein
VRPKGDTHVHGFTAAAETHQAFQKLGQTWDPREFGFVCSLPQFQQFIAKKDNETFLAMLGQEAATAPQKS